MICVSYVGMTLEGERLLQLGVASQDGFDADFSVEEAEVLDFQIDAKVGAGVEVAEVEGDSFTIGDAAADDSAVSPDNRNSRSKARFSCVTRVPWDLACATSHRSARVKSSEAIRTVDLSAPSMIFLIC